MKIESLDHLVLTVADLEATQAFYRDGLGLGVEHFAGGRVALVFGEGDSRRKINLHPHGHEFEPKAAQVQPGSADLCFITATPLEQVAAELKALGIAIELGPVPRTGSRKPLLSLYIRDPDGNLVEIANEVG